MINDNSIIYDHPLNEVIRVCLRLEQLFQEIDHQLTDTSKLGTRHVIQLIYDVLHILDRPDLKAKLAKELNHHHHHLLRYSNTVDIDEAHLNHLIQQLEILATNLIESNVKIGHYLRDIELFNTLRMHLASPGGGCSFDVPLYSYWLQQPVEVRIQTITKWLKEFDQIKAIIALILDLVRNHAKVQQKTAVHGFYQELLDPQSSMRMIRISIASNLPAYPEISIGRHFLSVRFYSPDIEKRPIQYLDNLPFVIAYCGS